MDLRMYRPLAAALYANNALQRRHVFAAPVLRPAWGSAHGGRRQPSKRFSGTLFTNTKPFKLVIFSISGVSVYR